MVIKLNSASINQIIIEETLSKHFNDIKKNLPSFIKYGYYSSVDFWEKSKSQ